MACVAKCGESKSLVLSHSACAAARAVAGVFMLLVMSSEQSGPLIRAFLASFPLLSSFLQLLPPSPVPGPLIKWEVINSRCPFPPSLHPRLNQRSRSCAKDSSR